MRNSFDFSKLKQRKNPYPRLLKSSITIRLDRETVAYFKKIADKSGLRYQSLINMYLRECAMKRRKPSLNWLPPPGSSRKRRPQKAGSRIVSART